MSGMRPTGMLHIGHYYGTLLNWLKFQSEYDCFYSIVDWHALTTKYEESHQIKQNVFEVLLDWLSVGINPEIATVYLQSAIPEIAVLHLLLSMITPQNWVEREPTLKDMIKMLAKDETQALMRATYGLIGYPVLMTADILMFKGNLVPVGKDQESHLEFARDVARKFNSLYKVDYFPEPMPKFTQTPLIKGVDGQKMGKSFDNDIKIADTDADTVSKITKAITDRTRQTKNQPGHTDLCEVPYPLYKILVDENSLGKVKEECESAKIGCLDCKKQLAGVLNDTFREIRHKRSELAKKPDEVLKILDHGNKAASKIARQTLSDVESIMGFSVFSK